MRSLKLLLFLLLFEAPWLAGAAPFCLDLLGTSERAQIAGPSSDRVQTEQYLEHRLEPYLNQIPVKLSEKLVSKIAKKLHKKKISELDFHKLSLKFYKAIKGPFYKRFVNSFSKSRTNAELEQAEAFYRTLQNIASEYTVVPRETAWIKMRLKLIDHQAVLSWSKLAAAQTVVMWINYQMTGQVLYFPAFIPTSTALKFDGSMTPSKKSSFFYNQYLSSFHAGVTAVALAAFVMIPDQHSANPMAIVNDQILTVENHQRDILQVNNTLLDTSDLAKRTDSLTEEVDAIIAAHEAEQHPE